LQEVEEQQQEGMEGVDELVSTVVVCAQSMQHAAGMWQADEVQLFKAVVVVVVFSFFFFFFFFRFHRQCT
jgi:hypothetical protein